MLQLMYIITMATSTTFMFMEHPLSMGFTLLIQAIMVAMITGMLANNFWFSYILFMIMIGGMLVLFIYMTSVASNEKFLYSNKLLMLIMLMMMTSLSILLIDQFMTYQTTTNYDITNSSLPYSMSLSKFLNFPSNWLVIMMIIYLLITMIAVVKITETTYGPLRQKF